MVIHQLELGHASSSGRRLLRRLHRANLLAVDHRVQRCVVSDAVHTAGAGTLSALAAASREATATNPSTATPRPENPIARAVHGPQPTPSTCEPDSCETEGPRVRTYRNSGKWGSDRFT